LFLAETFYQHATEKEVTLKEWDEIVTATADFMVSYAWFNHSTGVYDLGPPMYPVSENTEPNNTVNPTFELAYWRFGLRVASQWKLRQHQTVPEAWTTLLKNLAPLPIVNTTGNETYELYEGIPNMWEDPDTTDDHPALIGVYGLLPTIPGVDESVVRNTAEEVYTTWNFTDCWGWDFGMLAMNAVKLGDAERAVEFLLDPLFEFDDVGMPVGGVRVATPYFPGAGGLLLAVGMMAGGWSGDEGGAESGVAGRWPEGWKVDVEGFGRGL
jgi:hypothetical protein